jgi:hypothetical protein
MTGGITYRHIDKGHLISILVLFQTEEVHQKQFIDSMLQCHIIPFLNSALWVYANEVFAVKLKKS